MSFYKEIAPFVEYVHSIRKLKNYLSFDMTFPTKWSLPKSIVDEGRVVGFEAENQNPIELQRDGWQAILNNYKKYTESV